MRIGKAGDRGGFELKVQLTPALKAPGNAVVEKIPDGQIAAKVRKSSAR